MPTIASFAGPVEISFQPGRPLPLTLSGQLRGVQGVSTILSFAVDAKPELPTDLNDAEVAAPAGQSQPQTYQLRAGGRDYPIKAQRLFVHRDLSVLMRDVVPPQSVSNGYRWRWRLGIFLARIPLLRSWLG
jgi:hypothetical protein